MWLLILACLPMVGAAPLDSTCDEGLPPDVKSETTALEPPRKEAPKGSAASVAYPLLLVNAETLSELQDDKAVREGDILVPLDRNAVWLLWSDAIVPYTISVDLAYREPDIQKAFKMISDVTCIRFKKRTTEFNYVKFMSGRGCASFVGVQGGDQPLFLSNSCGVGNLGHEIIHALGLHHEHTRQDRDQYVTVQWNNIIPGKQRNFEVKHGDTLNLPYDLASIMHYGKFFFSADGKPTIMPKKGDVNMGQRDNLSLMDIKKLNGLYHCEERTKLGR